MEITVQYTGQLANIAGTREEIVEMDGGSTVKHLVAHLAKRHGEQYADLVLTAGGEVRPSLLIISGSEQIEGAPEITPLDAGKTIMLMTPIAGG